MESFIQDYSYDNCFWGNEEFLYQHSKSKYKEYLSIGDFSYNISENINKFCKSIQQIKNEYQPFQEDCVSSRGKAIQSILDLIQLILTNLQQFSTLLAKISVKMGDKKFSYESKKCIKKMCSENSKKYENSIKSLNNKKESYYELINQGIELYLNYKLKKNKDINSSEKNNIIENILKKRKEYIEQINKVEKYRKEYIELQRNIFNSEEEFERDCTDEIKYYFQQILSCYEKLAIKDDVKQELKECIDNIDGANDIQKFAEKNRSIQTSPTRLAYMEYTENLEIYSNFEVVKHFYKNKENDNMKEKQKKISSEVKLFLNEIIKTQDNEKVLKFEEIANDIVNNSLKEEDFAFLINQFQKSYDDYTKWKEEENINFLDFKKVGENWDNRFCNMQLYLEAFNKIRMNNKELDEKRFDYFVQAMQKILFFNDNEDTDYKLCELLITLSSTFYKISQKDEKDIKVYASEIIKDAPLFQKTAFWIGIIKYELNDEFFTEKPKNKIKQKSKSFHVSASKKKKENIEEEKTDKKIIAKLMSVSYNLIQFVIDSDKLNKILANIFRCFKIDKENKELIIAMINSHIESEGASNLKLNEEMLLNCDNVEYNNNLKEKRAKLCSCTKLLVNKVIDINNDADSKIEFKPIKNDNIIKVNNVKKVHFLSEKKKSMKDDNA
jgi:hypothetical protein